MRFEYRLYLIGDDGRITMRHSYSAHDDLDALEHAKELCRKDEIEVWQSTRFVARVKPDGTASFVTTNGPHVDKGERAGH